MSPQVLIQLVAEGPALPVRELAWEYVGSCGCTFGVADADAYGVDRDVAWREFQPDAAERRRAEGSGYRFELAVRAEVCERIRRPCPHPRRVPQRVQRRRTAGWRMPPGVVYVGRPTKWGNPVQVGPGIDRAEAVRRYREVLAGDPHLVELARTELAGRDLACWCPLVVGDGRPVPCHADVLLHVSNGGDPMEDR